MTKSSCTKAVFLLLLLLSGAATTLAQWTHRYPKVEGYRHHVYLEGFELPVMGAGPTDPAPEPDGTSVAFAARVAVASRPREPLGATSDLQRGHGLEAGVLGRREAVGFHPGR